MKTKIGTLSSESLLAALILVTAAGCTHYWERPAGSIADFERDSAACIEDVRHSPFGSDSREQIYRACMRARGWKRVEVSVADDHQFRGPEDAEDFLKPPSPLSGKRYYQNR